VPSGLVSSGTELAKDYPEKACEVSMSTDADSLEAPGNRGLWVVQVLGATLCFIVGFAKLSGDEQMIQTFMLLALANGFVT
jgi:hypothetical protein